MNYRELLTIIRRLEIRILDFLEEDAKEGCPPISDIIVSEEEKAVIRTIDDLKYFLTKEVTK